MTTPEQEARAPIDVLLQSGGWSVQNASAANIHAARDVAIRALLGGLGVGPPSTGAMRIAAPLMG